MLDRIGKGEEIAPRILQSVSESDQFFPTVDRDQPAELQIAFELLGFDSEIDNVRVSPNKRMERLDVGGCRSILFATINFDRAGLAKLNRDDARRRVRAKEDFVLLEFHGSSTDCADSRRFKTGRFLEQSAPISIISGHEN